MNSENTVLKKALRPLIYALLLFTGVQLGIFLNKRTNVSSNSGIYVNSTIDEILSYVQANYVDTINLKKVETNTINLLLSQLDPHSIYIPKADYAAVNEPLVGNFEGIGIEFHIMLDTVMVVNPIVGGPSEMQGIKAGDKIVKINDTLVVGIGIQNNNVLSKLRGSKGSKVKLSIKRFGQKELINFYIVRDKIPLHSIEVAYMIDAEKGYIKINSFGANTYQEFKDKVSLLQKKGMKKLLIDLRQNGGGYLDASIQIADEIIGGSPLLVYTEGAHYPRQDYFASHTGIFENGTIGVILDEGSASASEILSGAIQDLDRGVIIGRRSFGKGLVMSDIQLMDGSSLRLSMAHYFTPSGRCVQKHYTNDILAYETEIFQRFFNQPTKIDSIDSIKNSKNYFTKKGKIVKGGGGIYPDIFVPVDTNYDLRAYAELRSDVPEFIYQQMPNIKEHISTFKTVEEFQKGFVIDMNLYQKFTQYLKEHKNPGLGKIVPLEPKIKIIMKAYIARQLWNNEGFYRIVNDMDKTYETAVKSI